MIMVRSKWGAYLNKILFFTVYDLLENTLACVSASRVKHEHVLQDFPTLRAQTRWNRDPFLFY